MISENLQVAIRNPKLLLKYLLRERNLVRFLSADAWKRSKVKAYFVEASKITNELVLKLPKKILSLALCSLH
jgi:hypothetical protein